MSNDQPGRAPAHAHDVARTTTRHPDTVAVSAGRPTAVGEPLNHPIVLASNIRGEEGVYARTHGVATWAGLEEAVGALEGGQATAFATGMAAASAALFALAPRVLVLTTFDLDEYVYGALQAGARGFLLKDAGPPLLAQAVRAAADGDALIAPSVTVRLLSTFASLRSAPKREPIEALTEREEEVVVAVADGSTNQEIARALHISLSTVKTHIASAMAKLSARNRVELAMWAYENRRGAR